MPARIDMFSRNLMNPSQFEELCQATAHLLQVEMSLQEGSRCTLSVDEADVLVDLDEEANMLYCYVDLGDPEQHDRAQACEQLLALNLSTHADHHGAYALEPASGRAIFCATLADAATVTGDELAETLRYYVEETEQARQMVANPSMHAVATQEGVGALFAGALA